VTPSVHKPFKFETVANVGDRIRSQDFHRCDDCYIEGTVTKKDTYGDEQGFACFVVTVDVDCWSGKIVTDGGRVGQTRYVPMEVAYDDWDDRIVKLS
jgi:hypothetical protein